jgi:hypothetical protein
MFASVATHILLADQLLEYEAYVSACSVQWAGSVHIDFSRKVEFCMTMSQ